MKNSAKSFTLLTMMLLFIASITSCNEKAAKTTEIVVEPTFNLTIAKTEIQDANKEFMALYATNDSIGLSNLYTQDAKFMMNGAPATIGRKNIQSTIAAIMKSGVSSVNLSTTDVWGTENIVTEEGELSLFVGDDKVDQGKYMVLWKKEEGKWKLHRDIFNSNLPEQ